MLLLDTDTTKRSPKTLERLESFITLLSRMVRANPAPLGLLAFGLTTTLLSLHNVGAYPLDGMIIGMAIFYGGIAQVIAGGFEMKHGKTVCIS